MARGKNTRADLRGKPLDKECYRAYTTTQEYGPDDDRTLCYGMMDDMTDDYLHECLVCGALVWNAKPLEVVE